MRTKSLLAFKCKTIALKFLYKFNKEKYCYTSCFYTSGEFNKVGSMAWYFYVFPHHYQWDFRQIKQKYVETVGDKKFSHTITWTETKRFDIKTGRLKHHHASEYDSVYEIIPFKPEDVKEKKPKMTKEQWEYHKAIHGEPTKKKNGREKKISTQDQTVRPE